MTVREAAGPLGRAIFADGRTIKPHQGYQLDQGANSLIVLRRTAFVDGQARIDKDAVNGLLRWAEEKGLGQEPQLVSAVAERRERAVAGSGLQSERLGERANAHEIGLLLHGTYGWPLIPGSTIKGVTRAYAVEVGVDAELVNLLLGPEPGAPKARRGRVAFLDALPAGGPLDVARDVLTPHVQPYYADTMTDSGPARPRPPAEYHNPVPFEYLVVSGGAFAIDILAGRSGDARTVADWCAAAIDELGVGGKTHGGYGYGYLTVDTRTGADG